MHRLALLFAALSSTAFGQLVAPPLAPDLRVTSIVDTGTANVQGNFFGGANFTNLTVPTNATFTQGTGTLAAATYYYRVTATNLVGETTPSAETSLAIAASKGVNVNWGKITGATGYKVYGRSTGAELLIGTITSGDTLTFLDDGSVTPSGAMPTVNTSGSVKTSANFVASGSVAVSGTTPPTRGMYTADGAQLTFSAGDVVGLRVLTSTNVVAEGVLITNSSRVSIGGVMDVTTNNGLGAGNSIAGLNYNGTATTPLGMYNGTQEAGVDREEFRVETGYPLARAGSKLFTGGTDAVAGFVEQFAFDGAGRLNTATQHFAATKRSGFWFLNTNADASHSASMMPAPTVVCALGTLGNDTSDTSRSLVSYTTSAILNDVCGIEGPLTVTKELYRPRATGVFRTDPSVVTFVRYWMGISAAGLSATDSSAGGTYCAFRFSTSASDVNWMACSSDATTASCTSTGVAVAAAATKTLQVDWFYPGNCLFRIDGVVKVNKTSNIAASSSAALGIIASATALTVAGEARAFSLGSVALEQNP